MQIRNNSGCCPNANAKIFEIILIIGFLLTIILLIVNLALTIWFFKNSHSLFIIEIGLLGLNALSFILSIILRIWRSDGSVLNSNLSSSNTVAVINLIVVIINLLLSIAEEVLFSFVFPYINYMYNLYNLCNDDNDDNDDNDGWNDDYLNILGGLGVINNLIKKKKNFYKIMDKLDEEEDEFGFDEDDNDLSKVLIKLNISRNVTNQTTQNIMLGKRKSSNLKKLGLSNIDSAQKNLGKKKHKKKSKRKSIRVHNKY